MKQNWAERLRASMHHQAESLGNLLVEAFHYLALFAIGATVFWAAGAAFLGMVNKGHASIDDILLLFIYPSWARWSVSTSRPTTCRYAS